MLVADQSPGSVTAFQSKVYGLCFQIPAGSFATYKDISDALHSSPRAVGQALKRNPFAPTVPCHRVISSNFYLGGFFGDWGKDSHHGERKLILLKSEGLEFDSDGYLSKDMRVLNHYSEFSTAIPITSTSDIASCVDSTQ
ncbi:hypothetical protein BDV3_004392 [Batrachochytrium dendrobatidis]|nr:hypothetical protein O5D80_007960 [Batrachochytrium dendrobatidis]KAK5672900.1 hypothetical protein QVD99_000385 [Batrachochytrium dendrobatidis]